MLAYNLRIAAKSLRRNPALTTLLIAAIAVGICISTTFTTLRHAFAKDPLPGQSGNLFYVRLDNWDPARAYEADNPKSLPTQISYRDMRELMKSRIPTRQTATFKSEFFIHPDPKVGRPYSEQVRFVYSDFFPMFRLPFAYGSGWDKAADAKPEPVAVIDAATNLKLFGGGNNVGKSVRIEDRTYRVVGILDRWRPPVKFYDLTQNVVAPPEAIYLPFRLTPLLQVRPGGNVDGWKPPSGPNYEDFLESEVVWLQFWVELPTVRQQQAYRDFVNAYVREQKRLGRFARPLHTEVTSLPDLIREFRIVRPEFNAMAVVSLLFLAVCALNLIGLLLGKFLARAPEVSVRRALGASRAQVFWQHVVECELIGFVGGAIGLTVSLGMLALASKLLPGNVPLTLDGEMIASAVFLSLVAGLVAGLYPAWRICTLPPASQLKLQ